MAIRKLTLPNNTTYDIGVRESEIDWGTRNLGGASYSVGDVYFNDFLKANRFAGLKVAGITAEYSTDAGSTWNTYETTDINKRNLFTYNGGFYVGGSPTATVTADSQLRITIDTGKAGLYTVLRKILIYISTNYSQNCKVTIKAALQSNPTNYTLTICNNLPIGGWSGWNVIPCNFVTYGNTPASQYGRIQFIFTQTGLSDTTKKGGLIISRIFAYGGVGWITPSSMALHGHAYSWDGDLNVTFPAKVTATGGFAGNVTGNVSGTSANVTGTVAVANGGTGQTSAVNAANAFMNALDTGSSDPQDNDYYISQYAGGGTATTTYHRRPVSALWNYIKGKIGNILGLTATNYGGTSAKATADASGNTITTYYAPKSTAVTNVALATNKITKTINGTTTDVVTAASTSAYGITKLNTATNSTSTTEAATPSAVKTAYDLASTANDTAIVALSGVNGTLIYDHTYTISNGVATFTPHVYLKGAEVTTNYNKSCFGWKYRLINGSEVALTTNNDRGCTVTITNLGYGGHVIGTFTPS